VLSPEQPSRDFCIDDGRSVDAERVKNKAGERFDCPEQKKTHSHDPLGQWPHNDTQFYYKDPEETNSQVLVVLG